MTFNKFNINCFIFLIFVNLSLIYLDGKYCKRWEMLSSVTPYHQFNILQLHYLVGIKHVGLGQSTKVIVKV